MHVPDGFLNVPTSLATGLVAAVGVGLALRGARKELDERTAPLAGVVAAFVFATQMINFPVGAGTSGHLLGGALAVALVGPWTGVLVISVVLFVQALLFADGGLTALGTNITLMALVGAGVAWLVIVAVRRMLPKRAEPRCRSRLPSALWCRFRPPRPRSRSCSPRRCCRHPRRRCAHRDGRVAQPDRHRRGGDHRAGGQCGRGHPT